MFAFFENAGEICLLSFFSTLIYQQRFEMTSLSFYAPFEKGAYCFATVGRSVNQVLSAQYLLIPSLDQYQTWCRGSPKWVDDPYWFSDHMFKGQGKTTLLSPLYCPLNFFWPLHLINCCATVGRSVDRSVCRPSFVRSISFVPMSIKMDAQYYSH